ncbi:hypothetical protein IT087_03240 [Candidatus Uhrbacteria bacterium]|nr:hypothetical protein [Candidatus Uhrbacteria bacterium]
MAQHPLFVLIAPSGAGKTELEKALKARFPHMVHIRSCTSRPRRIADNEPLDAYHFLTPEEFAAQIEAGEFVEWARPYGEFCYGRRHRDLVPLQTSPGYADMTEHGVAKFQAKEIPNVVYIRVRPRNYQPAERDGARAAGDAERELIPIRVDYEIDNDHGRPDGLAQAISRLLAIVQTHLPH